MIKLKKKVLILLWKLLQMRESPPGGGTITFATSNSSVSQSSPPHIVFFKNSEINKLVSAPTSPQLISLLLCSVTQNSLHEFPTLAASPFSSLPCTERLSPRTPMNPAKSYHPFSRAFVTSAHLLLEMLPRLGPWATLRLASLLLLAFVDGFSTPWIQGTAGLTSQLFTGTSLSGRLS